MEKKLLKEKLLEINLVNDNEWLDKYVDLIVANLDTAKIRFETQSHHIIPKYYYLKNNIKIDNNKNNRVNLYYKDHILAHYYLSRCSSSIYYKFSNIATLNIICSKYDKSSIDELDLDYVQKVYSEFQSSNYDFNPMFNEEKKLEHDDKMRSDCVRNKISNTMKNKIANGQFFNEEHRKNISLGQKGMIYINKDGVYTRVHKCELSKYLDDGWVKGGRPLSEKHKQAIRNSHLGKKYSDELRKKLSDAHKGISPANKGKPMPEAQRKYYSDLYKGRKWVTNGVIQKQVPPEDIDSYIQQGFWLGTKSNKKLKEGGTNE